MTVFNCNGECESCSLSRRYREDGDDYYTCDSNKTRGIRVMTPRSIHILHVSLQSTQES